jgi:hypothetical protein
MAVIAESDLPVTALKGKKPRPFVRQSDTAARRRVLAMREATMTKSRQQPARRAEKAKSRKATGCTSSRTRSSC